jgi:hypothetical protein
MDIGTGKYYPAGTETLLEEDKRWETPLQAPLDPMAHCFLEEKGSDEHPHKYPTAMASFPISYHFLIEPLFYG